MGKKRSNKGGNGHWKAASSELQAVTKQVPNTTQQKRNECDLCHDATVIRYPYKDKRYVCERCFASWRQWREVLELVEQECDMLFAPIDEPEIGYDSNCGMKPYTKWKADNIAYFRTPQRRAWVIDQLKDHHWKSGKTIIWPIRMATA